MPDKLPSRNQAPYTVMQTPRGSVVVCGSHLVTEEIRPVEAYSLAAALNMEHRKRIDGQ